MKKLATHLATSQIYGPHSPPNHIHQTTNGIAKPLTLQRATKQGNHNPTHTNQSWSIYLRSQRTTTQLGKHQYIGTIRIPQRLLTTTPGLHVSWIRNGPVTVVKPHLNRERNPPERNRHPIYRPLNRVVTNRWVVHKSYTSRHKKKKNNTYDTSIGIVAHGKPNGILPRHRL